MEEETRSIDPMPTYKQAPGIFAVAVVALSVVSVILVSGMLYLAIIGKPVPEGVSLTIGLSLGALAGMITPRGENK